MKKLKFIPVLLLFVLASCNSVRVNADYDKILDTYLLRETASRDYLDCNEKLRGFGGMCLPKDTHAINILIKQLGLNYSLFESVINDNKQFKITLRDD